MARRIAYKGTAFMIAFARERNDSCPGCEFFDQLGLSDQAKLMALFKIAGDHGKFHNPEKFGDLGGGLYEFKSFQIRMPFAYARSERGLILITHGFIKKKDKASKEEIARAWRIFDEDQSATKLAVVPKPGSERAVQKAKR
jgi:phage-related protein